ncbi:unnamed protein product [Sphagnum balticum]
MEEACADGNLELVKESFKSLLLSSDGTIPLTDRVMPGGAEVIQRSTCVAARHGHTAIFSFLLDQGAPINAIVAGAAFEGNNADSVKRCSIMDGSHELERSLIGLLNSIHDVKFHTNLNTEAY